MYMRKANFVLKVSNLEVARKMYGSLNFNEEFYDCNNGLSLLTSPDIDKWKWGTYLLINNNDIDYSSYVSDSYSILSPGDKTYCEVNGLSDLLNDIDFDDDIKDLFTPLNTYKWGSQDCNVNIPGGYHLVLWEHAKWSDEEMLNYYNNLPNSLELSINGLNDIQLNLSRAEGKWSIKQNALHLMDSHLSFPIRIKFAIAENGRDWVGNPYDQDVWAENLDYVNRSITTELEFFKVAVRNTIELINHFSESLDHYIMVSNNKSTVRDMLKLITLHSLEHIERIWETRDIHQIDS
jgi:hypothetical protein